MNFEFLIKRQGKRGQSKEDPERPTLVIDLKQGRLYPAIRHVNIERKNPENKTKVKIKEEEYRSLTERLNSSEFMLELGEKELEFWKNVKNKKIRNFKPQYKKFLDGLEKIIYKNSIKLNLGMESFKELIRNYGYSFYEMIALLTYIILYTDIPLFKEEKTKKDLFPTFILHLTLIILFQMNYRIKKSDLFLYLKLLNQKK